MRRSKAPCSSYWILIDLIPLLRLGGSLGADRMAVFAESVQYHSAAGEMQKECGPVASSGVTTSLRSIMRHPTCPSSQGVASPTEPGVWEYHLTRSGRDLEPVVEAIGVWGQRWVEA